MPVNSQLGTYAGLSNPRTMLVEGPFGAGKTTFAVETLLTWLESGVPPENILVLLPQPTLAPPFERALRSAERGPMGRVDIRTVSGLAREMVDLYWPLIADTAGFDQPRRQPRFLNIETAQYAISEFVEHAVFEGEFDALSLSPQQIARQVLDNLGKAALMGIDYHEVPERLAQAWGPERPRKRVLAYDAAGRLMDAFRGHCLSNSLVDFSLLIELFARLLGEPGFSEAFFQSRTHLIVEHVEEDAPFTHSLVANWLPHLEGALLTYEWWSGYRVFLGADPEGARVLREQVDGVVTLDRSYINSEGTAALLQEIDYTLRRENGTTRPAPEGVELALQGRYCRYYPEMLDWVADRIAGLVLEDTVPPGEIAVVAPFLSDALRFSLGQKLDRYGIPHISHRPSRALIEEPAARTVLTLAALARPDWEETPPVPDVASALQHAIAGLDPVRAGLLGRVVYRPRGDGERLLPFDNIKPDMQDRITYRAGQRYDRLREWLLDAAADADLPLDHLFSRLFGEVLSQPGFGFHDDPEAGRVVDELVQSARRFRRTLFEDGAQPQAEIGRLYAGIVRQGLLAGLYAESWQDEEVDAVFMGPAHTFLLRNRPVDVQFWLDAGSIGWWERLDQPLTHPYVLSPGWPAGELWTDADEYTRQQDMLYRIVSGLLRRCRQRVYLGISDLGEQGFEQRGPMLRVFQQILRRHPTRIEMPGDAGDEVA